MPVALYGLIGKTLSHSFSPAYFAKKFEREGIENAEYRAFELASIEEFPALLEQHSNLRGLNVTIPYKEAIIPYLDALSEEVEQIGAVNTIAFLKNGQLKGYNTDVIGFQQELEEVLQDYAHIRSALILGSGGAAKAVQWVLAKLGIAYRLVSRTTHADRLSYAQIDSTILQQHHLIVNTTPLGMYPRLDAAPNLPYASLTPLHFLFDLIYNPEETLSMQRGRAAGAGTRNGLGMLEGQAEAAWTIWEKAGNNGF